MTSCNYYALKAIKVIIKEDKISINVRHDRLFRLNALCFIKVAKC